MTGHSVRLVVCGFLLGMGVVLLIVLIDRRGPDHAMPTPTVCLVVQAFGADMWHCWDERDDHSVSVAPFVEAGTIRDPVEQVVWIVLETLISSPTPAMAPTCAPMPAISE